MEQQQQQQQVPLELNVKEPLLYKDNYFDARELKLLREEYGYGLISKENLTRHLTAFNEFPFLIDALMSSCNGGNAERNIHSDAWLNLLSKITYGSPQELALVCFDLCSNGEGRVKYTDVLRIAKAAGKIIRSHPLSNNTTNSNNPHTPTGTTDTTRLGDIIMDNNTANNQVDENFPISDFNINKNARATLNSSNGSAVSGNFSGGINDPGGFGLYGIASRNGGYEALSFPDDIVDNIFSSDRSSERTKKTGATYLSYKDFEFKAKFIPEISRCFGLFDSIYFLLIDPLKTKQPCTVVLENFLEVAQQVRGIWKKFHHCTVQLRDRFLVVTRKRHQNPWLSIPLWHCSSSVSGFHNRTVVVHNAKTRIRFRAPSTQDALFWVHYLREHSRGNHLFDGFAPPRTNNYCKWFVNAKNYFNGLLAIIPKANHQILIMGWAFTPQLYLNRDRSESNCPYFQYRIVQLVDLLLDRARAGVKIRVLVWNETNWGFMLNSHNVKHILENLHPNIEVVRHPAMVPLRWSHHQKLVIIDQRIAFIGGIDLVVGRYDDQYSRVCDLERPHIFTGNDYNNLVLGGTEATDPYVTQLDRTIQPRLPWHDTAICVVGETAFDAANSFIQIWNHAVSHVVRSNSYTRLVPYPGLLRELLDRGDVANAIFDLDSHPHRTDRVSDDMTCQMLRSVSPWSAGQTVEASYYRALMDAIRKARYYVYIQNQYFISSIMHKVPGNKISLAIVERISLAITTGTSFRLYIVLPVHQAGPVAGIATRAIVRWTRLTLFEGSDSIFGKLRQRFPHVDPHKYISVCALRNWQIANGVAFTEMVYVHSKLAIIDDQIVIVGSGNINDRSLRGARDSETGVIVSGGKRVPSIMDGQPCEASAFAQSMRLKLWRMHLGIIKDMSRYPLSDTRPLAPVPEVEMQQLEDQILDPVHDNTYVHIWSRIAQENTKAFQEVFGDGLVENWPSVKDGHRKIYRDVSIFS